MLQFTFPFRFHPASLDLIFTSQSSPCRPNTSLSCHHFTPPLLHLVTPSPRRLVTLSPCHLVTPPSRPRPRPRLVFVLVLISSLSSPCLFSYLCIPLSIPFPGPCILLTLIPVPLISFVIPVYHLYSSFHLRPSSRLLVSPFVLFSTCSLILDHVLPVFYSHHGHPSPGSRTSRYLCFLSCTYTAWSVLAFSLVLILSHM